MGKILDSDICMDKISDLGIYTPLLGKFINRHEDYVILENLDSSLIALNLKTGKKENLETGKQIK